MLSSICHCQMAALAAPAVGRSWLAALAPGVTRAMYTIPRALPRTLGQQQRLMSSARADSRRSSGVRGGKTFSSSISRDGKARRTTPKTTATNVPDRSRPAFQDMALLCSDVKAALADMKLRHPTAIQAAAIPRITEGNHVLCAAETGSGKTLAYLIPVINRLRLDEQAGLVCRVRRPRALVLVPSTELARQVLGVVKQMSFKAPVRSVGLFGGLKNKHVESSLENTADVVVATPGLLNKYVEEGKLALTDIACAVVDEADTMLHKDFADEVFKALKPLVHRMHLPPPPPQDPSAVERADEKTAAAVESLDTGKWRPQIVAATATVTKSLLKTLTDTFPDIRQATTTNVHRCLDNIRHEFERVRGHDDTKKQTLLDVLKKRVGKTKIMVFCNHMDSAEWTSAMLAGNGVRNIKLHSGLQAKDRKAAWDAFKESEDGVLVCTDIASRGLDDVDVGLVVMFDFPKTVTDYLHRAGRTARMGRPGTVISLYSTKDYELATKIKLAVEKDHSLNSLFRALAAPESYAAPAKSASVAYGVRSDNNEGGQARSRRGSSAGGAGKHNSDTAKTHRSSAASAFARSRN